MARKFATDLRLIRPRARRIPALGTLMFAVCVLLVFNLSGWKFYRYLDASKKNDLTQRLKSVARTSALSLGTREFSPFLAEVAALEPEEQAARLNQFGDTPEFDTLLKLILQMQFRSGLSQLTLITPAGGVIADGGRRSNPGDPYIFTVIDSAYMQQARDGHEAVTDLYEVSGEMFQRTYQPVILDDGKVVALLQASISSDFVLELKAMKGQVARLWVMSSLLLLGIGFSVYRLFRYLVALERSATQSARVEAMGALAGGVAHELRNPLAIIRALAEEVAAEQPSESISAQNAHDIVSETQRLSDLVTHFLSLSRAPQQGAASCLALRAEIGKVVELLRKGASPDAALDVDLSDAEIYVDSDERALRQLLLNLLINAREALKPAGGTVTVTLRPRKDLAEIRIQDDGVGIPKKDLPRIFEPFFTTKRAGTGLGLAISKGIAENLGGSLDIRSEEGVGTQVTVMLPVSKSCQDQATAISTSP